MLLYTQYLKYHTRQNVLLYNDIYINGQLLILFDDHCVLIETIYIVNYSIVDIAYTVFSLRTRKIMRIWTSYDEIRFFYFTRETNFSIQRMARRTHVTLCDKVCESLATGQWFSPDILVSSTNKTDRHDITEIVLKVALRAISLNLLYKNVRNRHNVANSWKLAQLYRSYCK